MVLYSCKIDSGLNANDLKSGEIGSFHNLKCKQSLFTFIDSDSLMGATWTNSEQETFLEQYASRLEELKSNLPARKTLLLEVYKKFVEQWGPETWGFNNLSQFKGNDEQILAQKQQKQLKVYRPFAFWGARSILTFVVHQRITKWYYDKDSLRAKRKPEAFLLPLSEKQADNLGRKRMARPLDRYYKLYIATDDARRQELDKKYEDYKDGGGKAAKMNWRIPLLEEWFANESQEVQAHVDFDRQNEMGYIKKNAPEGKGDASSEELAQDAAQKSETDRLERVNVQHL